MDLEELKETDIWTLYEQGRNYMRLKNIFSDTDKNYRFCNGNQWEGAKIEGIEQAQFNFIKTIVEHKTSSIFLVKILKIENLEKLRKALAKCLTKKLVEYGKKIVWI